LSNDKASAIFRLAKNSSTVPTVATLGISIEPIEVVGQELAALKTTGGMKNVSPEMTVTQVGHLAGRILENIFNHVAMFTVNNVPISTVPLPQLIEQGFLSIKDFQNWYKSLKRKSQADPHFLDS
jgi:hypothetical protein